MSTVNSAGLIFFVIGAAFSCLGIIFLIIPPKPAAPITVADQMPTIWGDGIHDDTDGIGALFSGNLFRYRPGAVVITNTEDGKRLFTLQGTYLFPNGFPALPPDGYGPRIIQGVWPVDIRVALESHCEPCVEFSAFGGGAS